MTCTVITNMLGVLECARQRSIFLWAALLFLAVGPSEAQQSTVLTLERTIEIAQKNSPDARMAQLEVEGADWRYRSFRAGYRPSFSIAGEGPGLLRSISDVVQDDGSVRYVSQARTYSTVGLRINQPIAATGGQVFVTSGLSRIDLFGNVNSNQWQSTPLSVGFVQPLFQYNAMRWDRQIEPLRHDAARRRHAENIAELAVSITQRFFDVVIAQMNVERATFNVAVNDTIFTLSQGRFDIGRIAENDLLESELALLNAQTELSDMQIAHDQARQELKTALDLAPGTPIDVVIPFDAPPVEVDPAEAVRQARRNRSVFSDMQVAVLTAEEAVASTRSANGVSANLNGSFGLNQTGGRLGDVYVDPLNQQRFSLGFTIPLYAWGQSEAEVEAAIVERRRVQEQVNQQERLVEQEVYFEALQLNQFRRQLDLAAKADTIGTRRFNVARNRYTIGNVDITALFLAQQAKDAANQAYIRTLQQFWTSYFRLRQLTLYDFSLGVPLAPPHP